MTDEAVLLAAVAASPADDTPRLVYADWLEERGQAIRAEFIRLQCRIAQVETQPRVVVNAHVGLWMRQQELLDEHMADRPARLIGPAGEIEGDYYVDCQRGFPAELRMRADVFLDNGPLIAGLLPPPQVRVTHFWERVVEFLDSPHVGCVTAVHGGRDRDYALAEALLLFNPQRLAARVANFARLTELDLEACGIGDIECETLAVLNFPALERLDLSHNDITAVGVALVLDGSLPRQLKRLVLGGNPLTDQAAVEIADRWPRNSPLENLNLRFTNIGTAGQQALLARFGGKVDLF